MSMQDEINEVARICQFDADEELFGCIFGTVNGPGIDGREGILFWTNQRVGLSVTEGWNSETFFSIGLARIKSINGETAFDTIIVNTLDGKLRVDPEDASGETVDATVATLKTWMRQFIRVDHHVHYDRAMECVQGEDLPGAMAHLQQLVKKQPDRSPGILLKAWVHMDLGQPLEALDDLRKVLKLGTDDVGAVHVSMAQCASRLDDSEAVLRHATMACEQYDKPEGWRVRGSHHLDNFDTTEASADLRRVTTLLPDEAETWWDWARLGMLTEEVSYLEQARANFKRLDLDIGMRNSDLGICCIKEDYETCILKGTALLDEEGLALPGAYAMVTAILRAGQARHRALVPRIEEAAGDGLVFLISGMLEATFGDHKALSARLDELEGEAEAIAVFAKLATIRDILQPNKQPEKRLVQAEAVLAEFDDPNRNRLWDEVKPHVQWLCAEDLLALDRSAEARRLLQDVEAARPKSRFWTDEELEQRLAQAYSATVGRSTGSEEVQSLSSPQAATSPYEVARRLVAHLDEAPSLRSYAAKASELLAHFDEPPLVTVMGEYSVGKSTFINALVGRDLLPSGEGVTTGAITWLRYGNPERVRIVLFDGSIRELPGARSVADAVRETGGSEDFIRQVKYVEVFLDAPVLQKVHIVDSPGLNAPFKEHQKLTEDFLNDADAVLFLFNVEQAGRSTEADFLKRVSEHRRKAVAVVNQIDLVPRDELEEVMEDLQKELGAHFAAIMGVSALQALKGQLQDNERLLTKSKMPALRSFLDENLLSQARELKVSATTVKLDELCIELEGELRERSTAVDEESARIKGCMDRFNSWYHDEFADTISQCTQAISAGFEHAIDDATVSLVDLSSTNQLIVGSINGVARLFEQQIQDVLNTQKQELMTTLGPVLKRLGTELEGEAAWSPIHGPGLRALRSERERAESTLTLHVENGRAFSAGFVEGRGFYAGLSSEMSDDTRRNSEAVGRMLRQRTGSIRSRMESGLRRWAKEQRERIALIVTEMETATRREGVRVREQEFRPALALRSSLALASAPTSRAAEPSTPPPPKKAPHPTAPNALTMEQLAESYSEYTRLRHRTGHSNAFPFPRFRKMVEDSWARQREKYPTADLRIKVNESEGKVRLAVGRVR